LQTRRHHSESLKDRAERAEESSVIHVRRATLDDLEKMAAAYSAAWRDAFVDMFSVATFVNEKFETERSSEVRSIVLDEAVTTNVVELDGRIVGFSGFADDGCLDDLWVHPSAWGAGVAPVLVAAHEDEQRSIGRRRLTSWVPEDSPRARGLMAKLGWQPTGEAQQMVIYPEQPNRLFEYQRVLV
jgi:GNAT superfamily N-acetyltransferase